MVVSVWREMPEFDCMAAFGKWVETFKLLFSHHIKPNKSRNLYNKIIFSLLFFTLFRELFGSISLAAKCMGLT